MVHFCQIINEEPQSVKRLNMHLHYRQGRGGGVGCLISCSSSILLLQSGLQDISVSCVIIVQSSCTSASRQVQSVFIWSSKLPTIARFGVLMKVDCSRRVKAFVKRWHLAPFCRRLCPCPTSLRACMKSGTAKSSSAAMPDVFFATTFTTARCNARHHASAATACSSTCRCTPSPTPSSRRILCASS